MVFVSNPSSSLISCLKLQKSNSCSGQSFLDCGQPTCTVLVGLPSIGSDYVASLSSCNLVLLTGADCVMWCTGMTSMLESIALGLVDCSGADPAECISDDILFSSEEFYVQVIMH